MERVVIVLAKAPVPGRVKTRLCPPASPVEAAELAAAALADTLAAACAVPGARVVVALDGDLAPAAGGRGLRAALARVVTVRQRGSSLGERIAAAHHDVAELAPRAATLQIGMDTPQVTPALLASGFAALDGTAAALGRATDGGWWALGLRDPRDAALVRDVPTSRADTGERTAAALRVAGLTVAGLPELTDVDTMADAHAVALLCRGSRFAAAIAALGSSAA